MYMNKITVENGASMF